jgi:hypothetical protein
MFQEHPVSNEVFGRAKNIALQAPVRFSRAEIERDLSILERAFDLSTDPSTGDFLIIFA